MHKTGHKLFTVLYCCVIFDREAYRVGKKEKPPFLESDKPDPVEEEKNIPGELLCSLCKDILKDAVVIQCCGNSFCDECKPLLVTC